MLAPAGITVDDGTVTFALLLAKETEAPPLGAAAVRVIVQVELPAPLSEAGLQDSPPNSADAAVRLKPVVVEEPFAVAVIVTGVVAETLPAVAVNVAVLLPAATVTEAGTVSAVLVSEMETDKPPAGAALFNPRVQMVEAPEDTVAGEQLSVEGTAGAMRLKEALAVVLLKVAVSPAVLLVDTVDTDAVKLAVEAPDATVTEAGIVMKALLSDRDTMAPPVGAGAFRVTVQAELPAPVNEEGVQASEDSPTGTTTGTVTTPPVAAVVMLAPAAVDALAPVIVIGLLGLALEDSVRFTMAASPSAMVVVLNPNTKQV